MLKKKKKQLSKTKQKYILYLKLCLVITLAKIMLHQHAYIFPTNSTKFLTCLNNINSYILAISVMMFFSRCLYIIL